MLNPPSLAAFAHNFGHLFEHSPWVVEQAYQRRPFANPDALHLALMQVVWDAAPELQQRLIEAHPELGAKVALTRESKAEQAGAGLRHLSAAEYARFGAMNAAYRRKFGFPFIICVRQHDKAEIFAAFEKRLAHDAAAEHQTALREIGEITRLRLMDLQCDRSAA